MPDLVGTALNSLRPMWSPSNPPTAWPRFNPDVIHPAKTSRVDPRAARMSARPWRPMAPWPKAPAPCNSPRRARAELLSAFSSFWSAGGGPYSSPRLVPSFHSAAPTTRVKVIPPPPPRFGLLPSYPGPGPVVVHGPRSPSSSNPRIWSSKLPPPPRPPFTRHRFQTLASPSARSTIALIFSCILRADDDHLLDLRQRARLEPLSSSPSAYLSSTSPEQLAGSDSHDLIFPAAIQRPRAFCFFSSRYRSASLLAVFLPPPPPPPS